MWTMDNTEGFSQAELDTINAAQRIVMAQAPGVDESNINDALNDAWLGGMTSEQLAKAALRRLGQ